MKPILREKAWIIFTGLGLLLIFWGLHMIFFVPRIDGSHWEWMDPTPAVIEYIKYLLFRLHGIWMVAVGVLTTTIAGTGFRERRCWAWYLMTYTPVHIMLLGVSFYWLFFFTIPLFVLVVAALVLTRPEVVGSNI